MSESIPIPAEAVADTAAALPRPAPVRCGADALRVLFLSASFPLEAETIAFLLDAHGNGGVVTIVSGTTQPDSVLAVAECLSRAAEGVPHACSLVLATVRPTGCVLPGDIDRWLEASDLAAASGVQLLEWFIITPAGAQCPRDLLGEPERWGRLTPEPA